MKKLILSLLLMLFSSPALAGTCPGYVDPMTSCPDYTDGSNILNIIPQYQTAGGQTIVWTTSADLTTAGVPECNTGGFPDDRCIAAATLNVVKTVVTDLAGKYNAPAGTISQYVRGDGSLATLPGPGSRTFNYPSRSLNNCFQISSTKDSDFHYQVDITTGLFLTAGAQGTVTATSYTNSGCTTGAQVLTTATASQTGTLVVGLAVNQTVSVGIDGTLPAGRWMNITTANTVGTPSFAIRSAQAEILLP